LENGAIISLKRLLFVSTSVGPLQSGVTGGVKNAIITAYKALSTHYDIQIIAPKDSNLPNIPVTCIPGNLQPSIQLKKQKSTYEIHPNSFLENAWQYARENQSQFEFIINFANDWLPYFLTPFFDTPVLHRISLSSENSVMNHTLKKTPPNHLAGLSQPQIDSFGLKSIFTLTQAIDIKQYQFYPNPETDALLFIGRVSPEKGVETAAKAAQNAQRKLHVFGYIQDTLYFEKITKAYPNTIVYKGYVSQKELGKKIGQYSGLLCLHHWEEAFGIVILEALACGVPVIATKKGGPTVIIQHEKTGFLTDSSSEYISKLDTINRYDCRKFVEKNHSLKMLRESYEQWFKRVRLPS